MIRDELKKAVSDATGRAEETIIIEKPKNNQADYAASVFGIAKEEGKSPNELGRVLTDKLSKEKPSGVEKVEASGGYINFFLSPDYLQQELVRISKEQHFGRNDSFAGKVVMVEYTDPNPFKLFHIGHLMSNTIGESIARLYTASNANVLRVNYQGDKGLHVAMAVWGMQKMISEMPKENDPLLDKVSFLGQAYALGSKKYQIADDNAFQEIQEINNLIYINDASAMNLYEQGKKWSLEYFEEQYKRLGTKFSHYFFESEIADDGLKIIKSHPEIFVEGDGGAIVFKGEDHGLHTRVFINSHGLPTYEAKELGVNKKKFDEYHPDLSVIVTANEVNEYFKVLLKVMSLIMPEVAEKTRHVGHGVMRLPSGKMSSRTGDVMTADSLIDQAKEKFKEKESEEMDDETREAVAVGAIKYSILKQSIGKDIIFDFDTSLAVKGDSGPYLQYTYARLKAIIAKAGERADAKPDVAELVDPSELALIKHFLEFPVVIREAGDMLAPQRVALYVFELANLSNSFYEKVHILDDEDSGRVSARLLLIATAALILHRGLSVLGIKTPERI